MKKLYLIIALFPLTLKAQDIHFTQWNNNPLLLNPAQTGNFDGQARIIAQQRTQWASVTIPFVSTSLGIDFPIKCLDIGFQMLRDQAGSSRLRSTQFNFNLAKAYKDWRFGLVLGIQQRSIDYSELIFLQANEKIPSLNKQFFDLGLGVNRSFQIATNHQLSADLSMLHINRPNRGFLEKDPLAIRHQLAFYHQWKSSNQLSLIPHMHLSFQAQQREWTLGALATYDLSNIYDKPIKLEVGSYARIQDAVAFHLGMYLEQSYVGFSYDWNISDLVPASKGLGAWEVSFKYYIQQKVLLPPSLKTCPIYL